MKILLWIMAHILIQCVYYMTTTNTNCCEIFSHTLSTILAIVPVQNQINDFYLCELILIKVFNSFTLIMLFVIHTVTHWTRYYILVSHKFSTATKQIQFMNFSGSTLTKQKVWWCVKNSNCTAVNGHSHQYQYVQCSS